MLYVLIETSMNGDVTTSIHITGIESETFVEAESIAKKWFAKNVPLQEFKYWEVDEHRLSYRSDNIFGGMNDLGLNIIGIKDVE